MRFAKTTDCQRCFTHQDDLSTDLRALYYRTAVHVFNRYRGLFQGTEYEAATDRYSWDASTKKSDGDRVTAWRRYFVKARWQKEVPQPPIKLILPLTASLNAADQAASLLVVTQGPWYSVGGLAEEMEAQLVDIKDPTNPMKMPLRKEAGPDPILWKGIQDNLDVDYSDYLDQKLVGLAGPVGHTFDSNNSSPLLVSSSFVLRPLKIKNHEGADTSWYFAKVRFRRKFNEKGLHDTLRPPKCSAHEPFACSQWTEPFWVQFLPSNFFPDGSNGIGVEGTTLDVRSPSSIYLKRDKLTPSPPETDAFRQLLLLTVRVPDATGRMDQERYFALCNKQTDGSWKPDTEITDSFKDSLVGRIVEIQVAPPSHNKKNYDLPTLWRDLFPDEGEGFMSSVRNLQDSHARIVRVSPAIYARAPQECTV
jgi:hypothetical protein